MIFLLAALLNFASAQCIPPNHNFVSVSAKSGITRAAFMEAIVKVGNAYRGEVAAVGAELSINDMWNNPEANAQAYREGNVWHVDAFGGLARSRGMTKNGYIAVLCHEIGHHLGGAPLYPRDWASDEGQADYFATLKCMKKLGIDSTAASFALASVLADLGGERVPSRSLRDKSRVGRTSHSHPRAQCRLDTMDAGRACRASGPLSGSDPAKGTCHVYDNSGSPVGLANRPRCWYAP